MLQKSNANTHNRDADMGMKSWGFSLQVVPRGLAPAAFQPLTLKLTSRQSRRRTVGFYAIRRWFAARGSKNVDVGAPCTLDWQAVNRFGLGISSRDGDRRFCDDETPERYSRRRPDIVDVHNNRLMSTPSGHSRLTAHGAPSPATARFCRLAPGLGSAGMSSMFFGNASFDMTTSNPYFTIGSVSCTKSREPVL